METLGYSIKNQENIIIPMARIVVYKTSWDSGCYDAGLLAAFDDAIRDGVHILSLSLGAQSPQGDYFNDAISIGSFHAANRGVLVVSSVGNEGIPGSAANLAPLMLTVAASSTYRDFTSDILLGNSEKVTGESLSLEILKLDITAPGINILAAWSPATGNMFNILSGTSMACPHVTGIATLVKAVHPSWSPSAIKSAIMTTATILDKRHKPISVDPEQTRANAFDYGSGFLNPARVLDPGLVYDSKPTDFIAFLCSLGYDQRSLHLVTRDNSTCNSISTFNTASDLNHPSISVPNLRDSFSVTRVVTNVGKATSIYKSIVSSPRGVNVTVTPNRLVFTRMGQKIKFSVNFKVTSPSKGYKFGFLSWKNKRLQVTSPLVVKVG